MAQRLQQHRKLTEAMLQSEEPRAQPSSTRSPPPRPPPTPALPSEEGTGAGGPIVEAQLSRDGTNAAGNDSERLGHLVSTEQARVDMMKNLGGGGTPAPTVVQMVSNGYGGVGRHLETVKVAVANSSGGGCHSREDRIMQLKRRLGMNGNTQEMSENRAFNDSPEKAISFRMRAGSDDIRDTLRKTAVQEMNKDPSNDEATTQMPSQKCIDADLEARLQQVKKNFSAIRRQYCN
eukprot:gene16340-19397_t